ncbi:MAG: NAD(P)/FAD-dependent oxidoreductase, partial [Gammaproteobacteria bacterium]
MDSLRRENPAAKIVLVAGEPVLPYQRPPLSKKFLGGELEAERLPIRPASFYESIHCEVVLDNPVTAIDRNARRLTLADGSTLAYDKVVLTSGARARALPVPGADLAGVHLLRTIADVQAIRAELAQGRRAAIVGAGYIGLECAATLCKLGMKVSVIETLDRVMSRVVAPEVSRFYETEHRNHGVEILTGRRVEAFEGKDRVAAIACADGSRVPADIAIVGIGIVPNTELAAAAGLACDDGVVVDDHCRTSDPEIFAAGDCCSFLSLRYGRRVRLESV